jgi:pimeloyl-ACP methyl ester carboxylesterase
MCWTASDVGSASLIGHSFGGLAAVAMAASRPERCQAVIAADPYLANDEVRGRISRCRIAALSHKEHRSILL